LDPADGSEDEEQNLQGHVAVQARLEKNHAQDGAIGQAQGKVEDVRAGGPGHAGQPGGEAEQVAQGHGEGAHREEGSGEGFQGGHWTAAASGEEMQGCMANKSSNAAKVDLLFRGHFIVIASSPSGVPWE